MCSQELKRSKTIHRGVVKIEGELIHWLASGMKVEIVGRPSTKGALLCLGIIEKILRS